MGQQQVKALTDRTKSGKLSKSSLKNKDVEKAEFHVAAGKTPSNEAIALDLDTYAIRNRFLLVLRRVCKLMK